MARAIEKALDSLYSLIRAKSHKSLTSLLHKADIDLVYALTEIFYNVKEGNIFLTPTARQFLKKGKNLKKLSYCSRKLKNWKLMKRRLLAKGIDLVRYILPSVLAQIVRNGSTSSTI